VGVSVVVATYGDDEWHELAWERAIPSAQAQGVPVIHAIGRDITDARNTGLSQVQTREVVFLDADDELEPGYFDAMATRPAGSIGVPRVRYIRPKRHEPRPYFPRVAGTKHQFHDCTAECLSDGNWIVIGACVPTSLLRGIGGFRDFEWSEDFDLWVRCWKAGATFERVPDAIYRAHVRMDSRNRGASRETKLAAHQAIARANGLPVPA
jgi:GT2 family glycosyltransferase